MKKFILSVAIIGLTTVAFAQEGIPDSITIVPQQTESIAIQNGAEQPIKLADLPEAVKRALISEAYRAWTPTEAFLIKDDNGKAHYKITATKENTVAYIKINADGAPAK